LLSYRKKTLVKREVLSLSIQAAKGSSQREMSRRYEKHL
jgi:hypothetical protein